MTGVVSFAHRVSGAVLVLSLPVVVFLFALSLHSEQGFERVSEILQCGWVRLLSLLVLWALFSHLFSGVRFLLLDLDIGMRLAAARASAWLVLALAVLVLIALLIGVLL